MPSKGNPSVAVRFLPIELAALKATVDRINQRRREGPLSLAEWIRDCVNERMKKLSYRPKKVEPPQTITVDEIHVSHQKEVAS